MDHRQQTQKAMHSSSNRDATADIGGPILDSSKGRWGQELRPCWVTFAGLNQAMVETDLVFQKDITLLRSTSSAASLLLSLPSYKSIPLWLSRLNIMENQHSSLFRAIVVGGGVAGLTAAHALRKANMDHVVLERGSDQVEVQLADGTTEKGDMVIACDGVHSLIRESMWDNAN